MTMPVFAPTTAASAATAIRIPRFPTNHATFDATGLTSLPQLEPKVLKGLGGPTVEISRAGALASLRRQITLRHPRSGFV